MKFVLPTFCDNLLNEVFYQAGAYSSFRSRSGGTVIGKDIQAIPKIFAKESPARLQSSDFDSWRQ